MPLYDPRILLKKLEELSSQLDDWQYVSRDLLSGAQSRQRLFAARVEDASQDMSIKADELEHSREELDQLQRMILQYYDDSTHAKDLANETVQQAQQACTETITTQAYCKEQLQQARQWLARAHQRLEQAQIALSRANAEFVAASRDDDDSSHVSRAQRAIDAAKNEVQSALAEVVSAQQRVNQCEYAVQLADSAMVQSHLAFENAIVSSGYAERSLEHAEAASKAFASAQLAFEKIEEAVKGMKSEVEEVLVHIEEDASRSLRDAEYSEECLQHRTLEANTLLSYLMESLEHFNRRTL